jgi:hypothetical protein
MFDRKARLSYHDPATAPAGFLMLRESDNLSWARLDKRRDRK